MLHDKRGSVGIMGVAMITIMLAIGAFAMNLASIYTERVKLQRALDIAVVAAGSRPGAIADGKVSAEALATVADVAALNGFDRARVGAAVERDADGGEMLMATGATNVPLVLGEFLTDRQWIEIGGSSGVRVDGTSSSGECLRSMLGPTNIYNNAQVIGPGCTIGAATYLHVCNAAKLQGKTIAVKYSKAFQRHYICGTATVEPSPASFAYDQTSVDPYARDPRIAAIRTRLDRMRSPGWPYGSAAPGQAIRRSAPSSDVGIVLGNESAVRPAGLAYGKLSLTSSTLAFAAGAADPSCSRATTFSQPVELKGRSKVRLPAGCYVFASSFTVSEGAEVDFETDGTGRAAPDLVTLVFNGSISNAGSIRFGDARVTVAGSISNTGGRLMSFGDGDIVLAGGSIANGAGRFEKGDGTFYAQGGSFSNGAGSMIFGDGTFYLWGGSFSNASTGRVEFGNGPFIFYGGTLYNVSGDMTFGTGPFEFYGGSLALSRDSRTTFGVGNLNFYGGSVSFGGEKVIFGAGGNATEGGSSIFMSGGTLSLPASSIEAIGTTIAFDGGTISLYGTGKINITAPFNTNPKYGYRDVAVVVYGGAFNLYGGSGSANTMSGLIYVPRTNASIYGKQIIERPQNGCLQLLAGVVDIYQDARLDMGACTEGRLSAPKRTVLAR